MLMVAGVALHLIEYAGNRRKSHELGAELGSGYMERSPGWSCQSRINTSI